MLEINVSDNQGYNGWNIGDICYRKQQQCTIKAIDFHTNPPTLTVALASDIQREINTEFNLISKEATINKEEKDNIQDDISDYEMDILQEQLENQQLLPQKQIRKTARNKKNIIHNHLPSMTTAILLIICAICVIFMLSFGAVVLYFVSYFVWMDY
eukprot:176725_1